MYYHDAVDWLFKRLPMYQRIGNAAYKNDLSNSVKLDEMTGLPHKAYKIIHIAGTNGKGSTAHMVASVLQASGYKTGLFTSPHMVDYRERIKINGKLIDEQYVADFISEFKTRAEDVHPSFFELTNAMAFRYFADKEIDVAVVEVGLGGRLDSTNIVDPLLSVITNIGMDHQEYLGNTLSEIALEKAGIIKSNRPVIIGEKQESLKQLFIDHSKKLKAPIKFANDIFKVILKDRTYNTQAFSVKNIVNNDEFCVELDLSGNYQQKNLVTALGVFHQLNEFDIKVSDRQIIEGLSKIKQTTNFRGRWQVLSKKPFTICDTGHNFAAFGYILKQLADYNPARIHFVLGFVNDKEIDQILSLFPKDGLYYLTKANAPRSLDEKILLQKCFSKGLIGQSYTLVENAYKAALKNYKPGDIIFIGGSTFVVAEIF